MPPPHEACASDAPHHVQRVARPLDAAEYASVWRRHVARKPLPFPPPRGDFWILKVSFPVSSSKSGDRRDDRPAATSPEPADTSRMRWPHHGRVRSTRASILTTERRAATTAAATAAQ